MPRNRDPNTTSARPTRSASVSCGYSSGEYSRSASWMIIMSPVTAAKPRRSAAPLPPLRGWRSRTNPQLLLQPLEDLGRAVGRHVVDDDQLDAHLDGEDAADDFLDRVALVEDRASRPRAADRAGSRCAARWSVERGALMRRAARARPTANSDRPIGGDDQAVERQRPRRHEPTRRAAPGPTCARWCR